MTPVPVGGFGGGKDSSPSPAQGVLPEHPASVLRRRAGAALAGRLSRCAHVRAAIGWLARRAGCLIHSFHVRD